MLSTGNPQDGEQVVSSEKRGMRVMIAVLLTILFVAAAMLSAGAISATIHRYGLQALALRGELAAVGLGRGFSYSVIEHRTLRGAVNVVILPVRKTAYRWPAVEGLRAAA